MIQTDRYAYWAAKDATSKLRAWVCHTYSLEETRMPDGLINSLEQMDRAERERSFCGYSIDDAPCEFIDPIVQYLQILRAGRAGRRSRNGLPLYLVRRHQQIVADMRMLTGAGGCR
ncbi:hypothetical protein HLH33_09870 [Gluconacetobacter diazotrophicus]|uniref:Uncharacterized protein n=1 Tax=Gluconacetobacter diazotrophicus TaxID=33996 RepID=A0A7W4FF36_GLUDI|nr:hypothetical protein [Gluconacetobacter diazotrophicus]MBB2156611.1 hypothetical protein [Gluconacetobacter diazotrophicus]